MSRAGYEEILDSRKPRDPAARLDDKTKAMLQSLTSRPEWPEFLVWLGAQVENETIDRAAPNTGALLVIEGRRSLTRDLKALRNRVTDDRRDRKGE